MEKERRFRLGVCSHDAVPCPNAAACRARARAAGLRSRARGDRAGCRSPLRGPVSRGGRRPPGEGRGEAAPARVDPLHGVRGQRGRARDGGRDHGRRGRRARPSRVAVPRRRDRRGRDASRGSERERALEQHRRDPRRRLPAGPRVGARGVARRTGRRAARRDDRRAVSGSGPRAAAPLRRRSQRGELLLRNRREDGRVVLDRVPHRWDGRGRRRHDARRAHGVRPPPRRVLPDRGRRPRRHRLGCLTRQAGRQRPHGRRVHASRDLRPRPHSGPARRARAQARRRAARRGAPARRWRRRSRSRTGLRPRPGRARRTRSSRTPKGSTPR